MYRMYISGKWKIAHLAVITRTALVVHQLNNKYTRDITDIYIAMNGGVRVFTRSGRTS